MRWIGMLLLGCLAYGCEDQRLSGIQRENESVQAEIKQCKFVLKAIERERGRLTALLEQEKSLQAEIQSLKAAKFKKPH